MHELSVCLALLDKVQEIAVDYRCVVCGMRLTITHTQEEHPEAPRHCREDMAEVP